MSHESKLIIEEHEIQLSNLDKVLFPSSNITKEDVIGYYKDIAKLALPLYTNRALTMLRCPNGIDSQTFMQKEAPSYIPEWIERFTLPKKNGQVTHILVNNEATFTYLANQACISFHLALSTIDDIDNPRYLLFDIDPFADDRIIVKNILKRAKELLDYLQLNSFLQTTGSKGFHIYVPLKRIHSFDNVHAFAKMLGQYLAQEYSQEITIEQSKAKRGKRVFIDYARNSYGLNAIGPYSLRAKENAPIATPLHWDELDDKDLHSQTFHINNIFERIKNINDPWKDMLTLQLELNDSQKKLHALVN